MPSHPAKGLGTTVKDVFPPFNFVYLRYAVRIPGFTYLMGGLFSLQSLLSHSSIMDTLSLKLSSEDIAKGYISSFVHSSEIRKDFAKACRHWYPQHTMGSCRTFKKLYSSRFDLLRRTRQKVVSKTSNGKAYAGFSHAQWITILHSMTYVQEGTPEQTIETILGFCGINITAHQRDRTAT